ncbi:Hypothetical protein PHPALM_17230 [Phytophthora palmivora]|uniref:Reverse transcriptase RNase H-like domain-containing protein n=1 Tax=Phytophthora palmivora TaxID=4796 RepID=A0A2P4XMW6_9STRA|nr:Hypothetical protein PHPALM_17230 [Phytophthora palmivora]
MRIRIKAGCKPFRVKARKYAPGYQALLESFNDKLVSLGWVYENPSSRWACAALPVRKSGGSDFRQTVDYKPFNCQTEPMAGIMPDLHVDLEKVRRSRHFGRFDFIKGYWQLPLAKECQELLSFLAHPKIYTPRPDIDTYLDKLEELLELTAKFGFKLSVVKSCVYKQEVKWCGKVINGEGVTYDSGRIEELRNMPYPTNAGELQQFLCSTNWVRDSIVDYALLACPLQDTLDRTMAQVSRRTKRVASGLPVALTVQECAAYDAVMQALANSATIGFSKPEAEMILLTDASDVGWSVIVTQVASWESDADIQDQQHELRICLRGSFTGAQENWSIIEKEAFPILLVLHPGGFRMYCDHRNLIHIFAPGHGVRNHVRGKLLRWSMKLTKYRYTIEHIDGTHNVWADMVSRWAGTRPASSVALMRVTLRRQRDEDQSEDTSSSRNKRHGGSVPIRPFSDGNFLKNYKRHNNDTLWIAHKG